jgi:hypothetical protein
LKEKYKTLKMLRIYFTIDLISTIACWRMRIRIAVLSALARKPKAGELSQNNAKYVYHTEAEKIPNYIFRTFSRRKSLS